MRNNSEVHGAKSLDEIKQLTESPENQYFDRKSARLKIRDIARHVIAFANASGGRLAIGIEDDGTITGFQQQGAQNIDEIERCHIFECEPAPSVIASRLSVTNSHGETDTVLLLDVAASPDVVIHRKGDNTVFLRVGDKSRELNHEQTLRLEYDKNQRTFEDEIVQWSSFDDVDHEVLNEYKSKLGTSADDERVLRSRRFLVGGHLTNAGVLLFAKDPTQFLPQARLRVLRFQGENMETGAHINIVKDQSFDLPIPKIIRGASTLISSLLREFQYLGDDGQFATIPEYPQFAWFEGVVNAVIHRDYAFAGDYIRVSMYDDRLEIISPGRLPNIVTLDNMRTTRYARNPRIARALVEFGWARELNEGVQRIYNEMQEMFLKEPIYSEPGGSKVQLVLENSITSRMLRTEDSMEQRISKQVLESLSGYEISAVRLACLQKKVTVKELASYTHRAPKTIRPVLRSLVDKGIFDWHGSSMRDPSQYYTLR